MKKKVIKDEPVIEPISLTDEERFLEFLKDEQIKLAFATELKKYRGITLTAYLSRYSWRRFGANKVLQNGFRFIDTPQGRDYWLGMSDKWRQKLQEKK
jgi:hypothetical protein